ncbi:AMN [Cordylochernes scorpioides]|uniref:Protein amnionless n=1 Tax=Cordylochernes scorpioides TaxID=51811 RepID=A0ABY6KKI9_9ARAC|nr:AMN [Cordylochernes scorpioides]
MARTEGSRKTWHPRPLQWPSVSCEQDSLVFPPLVAELPVSLSQELVLPLNGVLFLPGNFSLQIPENSASCSGSETDFIKPQLVLIFLSSQHTQEFYERLLSGLPECVYTEVQVPSRPPAHWLDPYRWDQHPAVPHAERVPCPQDDVVIESGDQLEIDRGDVLVKSLEIGGEPYDMQRFAAELRTLQGQILFPNSGPIRVEDVPCEDDTGCSCGNDRPEVLSRICLLAQPQCPHDVPCTDPIQPRGHCCPMCGEHPTISSLHPTGPPAPGSSILLKPESGFRYTYLNDLFQRTLPATSVQGFMSRTNEGLIQIVFTDDHNSRGSAAKHAGSLRDQITSGIVALSHLHTPTTQIITFFLSDRSDAGQYLVSLVEARDTQSWVDTSSGGVVGLVIGLLLLAVLTFFGARFLRDRLVAPGFTFARFDRHSLKVELELGTTPHDELDPPARGLDNPLFSASKEALVDP